MQANFAVAFTRLPGTSAVSPKPYSVHYITQCESSGQHIQLLLLLLVTSENCICASHKTGDAKKFCDVVTIGRAIWRPTVAGELTANTLDSQEHASNSRE